MIPDFDEHGNLPPGIHPATWEQIAARYGYTAWRRELLDGFAAVVRALSAAGCRRVYLDGSFITDKEAPGDFDGCWEPAGVDTQQLLISAPSLLLDVVWPRREQKAAFKGEMFIADIPADPTTGEVFLYYFQRDRQGRPKGIILLELGDTS